MGHCLRLVVKQADVTPELALYRHRVAANEDTDAKSTRGRY